MSTVLNKIKLKENKHNFKLVMVLSFVLVAMSFFVVGNIYAHVPQAELLAKLLILLGGINFGLVFYLIKRFDKVTSSKEANS